METLIEILQKIENKPINTTNIIRKIPYLAEEIENERIKKIVTPKLPIIEEEVKKLLSQIKDCENIQKAHDYFDLLQRTVEALEGLAYKEKIDLSDSLWKFIKDFDRIDDKESRNYLFKEIKTGNYYL